MGGEAARSACLVDAALQFSGRGQAATGRAEFKYEL